MKKFKIEFTAPLSITVEVRANDVDEAKRIGWEIARMRADMLERLNASMRVGQSMKGLLLSEE
jgi:hypothetical protein